MEEFRKAEEHIGKANNKAATSPGQDSCDPNKSQRHQARVAPPHHEVVPPPYSTKRDAGSPFLSDFVLLESDKSTVETTNILASRVWKCCLFRSRKNPKLFKTFRRSNGYSSWKSKCQAWGWTLLPPFSSQQRHTQPS